MTTDDLQGSVEDLDSQDLPSLGISEASGVITLPANDAAGGSFDQAAHTNGSTPVKADREPKSDASPEGVGTSSDAGETSLGAWELLRFTLPTLGIWIINPVLRYARQKWRRNACKRNRQTWNICMPYLPGCTLCFHLSLPI